MLDNIPIIRGDGVVNGIVMDKAIVYNPGKISIPKIRLVPDRVSDEITRYKKALIDVKTQIELDQKSLIESIRESEADILQSHIMITRDPFFTEEVPQQIAQLRRNAEWIIMDRLNAVLDTFRNIDNIYLKERGRDIEDVSLRVIRRLTNQEGYALVRKLEGILVAKELIPSMIMYIDTDKIRGIVLEMGSETSHATILAKSLGIPVVIHAKGAVEKIESGERLIVDGDSGYVIPNPTKKFISEYKKIQNAYKKHQKTLAQASRLPAVTLDDVKITLNANIEIVPGAGLALHQGAEGVGLFRTELPFIIRNRLISEEEQYSIYKSLLKQFEKRPVTIRTLDIGGDKLLPFQESTPYLEANPFLGLRSIRISLLKPDIFRTQIRALLRASVHGRVKILLPMISSCEEMEKIIGIITEEKSELENLGIPFDKDVQIGAMIEIPSAALSADAIIMLCDFLSIGTNDLVQYTLAVDRTNENVAAYYIPENPAVLKLIHITASAAGKMGKPCAVCGELAGNTLFTPFFVGVGITELSMEPGLIPEVKKVVRNISKKHAARLAMELLAMKNVNRIKNTLKDFYAEVSGDIKARPGSSENTSSHYYSSGSSSPSSS